MGFSITFFILSAILLGMGIFFFCFKNPIWKRENRGYVVMSIFYLFMTGFTLYLGLSMPVYNEAHTFYETEFKVIDKSERMVRFEFLGIESKAYCEHCSLPDTLTVRYITDLLDNPSVFSIGYFEDGEYKNLEHIQ